jgi:hypothetical protein
VNETCERCPIEDCNERAHKPSILEQNSQKAALKEEVIAILNSQI